MRKKDIDTTWINYAFLYVIAFLFVCFFSTTTSILYDNHSFWNGDSGIFKEMGICLLQGGTPYVDLFDHKGPVLWFIQAFGIWISSKWGLMFLQSIFLCSTLIVWYYSTLFLTEKQPSSIIISILGLFFLLAFYERGNLCEEWSLPFISLPIYLYIKRWKKVKNKKTPIYNHADTFILGLCVGILAMIRLNNTAPLIGFALWHFTRCIQQKEYKRMWTDIALIIGGMAIIFVLCSLFYLIKSGWSGVYEMIYGTFIFNFIYINDTGNLPWDTYLKNYIPSVGCLFITFICLINKKTSINVIIPILLSYIITLLSIGRFGFVHYIIIFIPLIVLTIGTIEHTATKWTYVILALVILDSIQLGYNAADLFVFRILNKKSDTELKDGFSNYIKSIPNEERQSIYNGGLCHIAPCLFANENIHQCNRIVSQIHTCISPRLKQYETTHGIKNLQPIWVLTQSLRPEAIDEYLATHYTLADSIPGGQFDPIWCWKKNEHKSLESY